MEDIIILGGGVAGLSCLNALLDQGVSATLIEGGVIGSPKMCGEFIAPIALPILSRWNIFPLDIPQTEFCFNKKNIHIPFLKPAGALSRSHAEVMLAKRANSLGGIIRENTRVNSIVSENHHVIHLSSGEILRSKKLVVATGRFYKQKILDLKYIGIKFYINNVFEKNTLKMFQIRNGYLGIIPVDDAKSNCACLIKFQDGVITPLEFFEKYIAEHDLLKDYFATVDIDSLDWLYTTLPAFGWKKRPSESNIFCIGDAIGSFPPAIGSGFAHAITSATLASNFIIQNDAKNYYQTLSSFTLKLRWFGKILHHLMLTNNQTLSAFLLARRSLHQLFLQQLPYYQDDL